MIYFSNSNLATAHMTFIGRWDPFHKGHENLINQKRKEYPAKPIMIQVRMTDTDSFSPQVRAEFVKIWMLEKNINGTIVIVPNIEGIYWGRDVGYKVEQIDVDTAMKTISATNIRNKIKDANPEWKKGIPANNTISLLNPKASQIMESGLVVWLTGCPSSGKTTISSLLHKKIKKHFPLLKTQLLDGDVMRTGPLAKGTGFTPKDRAEHITKMGYLSKLFADHGIIVIASFVSPEKSVREKNKDLIGSNRYMEVYVKASKEVRIKRDVKGLYKKAIAGEIKDLTGFDAKYEEPTNPIIICNTQKESIDESVNKIFEFIFT